MKLLVLCAALMLCSISGLHAADLVSGTWTSGDGTAERIYVFKTSGDRLTGIVCGPCDNPASVFTNVMKFKWMSEGSGNTGEITMIGPVR